MDGEKTKQFILEQHVDFAAHTGAVHEQKANSARRIEAVDQALRELLQAERAKAARSAGKSAALFHVPITMQRRERRRLQPQEKRSEVFQQRFDQFMARFDAYLRRQRGNCG